jgi:hypothetical protein
LKAGAKDVAIWCFPDGGPIFGLDVAVWDNCNANTRSATGLGIQYTNNTGLAPDAFFTCSFHFQVKEIEVFEITG